MSDSSWIPDELRAELALAGLTVEAARGYRWNVRRRGHAALYPYGYGVVTRVRRNAYRLDFQGEHETHGTMESCLRRVLEASLVEELLP